ncbi:MAG: hypothetical protein AAF399_07275 [Bacteroidota bacterium]
MEKLFPRLQEVSRKVVKLERMVLRMNREKAQLQEQVSQLEQEKKALFQQHEEIQQKYEAAKLVKSLHTTEDREAVQLKIDRYLKEIDDCLKIFGE